jgi:hypothetical protein
VVRLRLYRQRQRASRAQHLPGKNVEGGFPALVDQNQEGASARVKGETDLTLEELQKLYSDLSDPEWKPDFDFNIRLNQAAGFETTRNGRGWCRRTPGESRWLALLHPMQELKHMLWLLEEALPPHRVILDFPSDRSLRAHADLTGAFDWPGARSGRDVCHALARVFVATLCGLRGGEIPP